MVLGVGEDRNQSAYESFDTCSVADWLGVGVRLVKFV